MKKYLFIITVMLQPVFAISQSIEVIGNLKVVEMDMANTENHLVVKQPDGTLATRLVSSLPSPEDTMRTLQSDLLLTSALCNCSSLPPAMIQSLLDNGYSFQDLINFNTPPADLLASGFTVEDLFNEGQSPLDLFNGGLPASTLYGQTYEGGLIFYLDTLDIHPSFEGLVSAPYDQSSGSNWGCYGAEILGADGTIIGTGNQNTADIKAGCSSSVIAAVICADLDLNGFIDWFLPSKDELSEMSLNIGNEAPFPNTNIGGFASDWYLSSSEFSANNTWGRNLGSNIIANFSKLSNDHVRAIRAF